MQGMPHLARGSNVNENDYLATKIRTVINILPLAILLCVKWTYLVCIRVIVVRNLQNMVYTVNIRKYLLLHLDQDKNNVFRKSRVCSIH